MKAGVSLGVLGIDISSDLDQSLHIFNMHELSGEVKCTCLVFIELRDSNVVAAGE